MSLRTFKICGVIEKALEHEQDAWISVLVTLLVFCVL